MLIIEVLMVCFYGLILLLPFVVANKYKLTNICFGSCCGFSLNLLKVLMPGLSCPSPYRDLPGDDPQSHYNFCCISDLNLEG